MIQTNKVISQGIEIDFRGQITKQLQLTGNYTYNHTEIKDAPNNLQEGLPLGNAPKHIAGIWAKYIFPKTIFKGLGCGVGAYYTSERRMDNAMETDAGGNPIFAYWPSYTTINTAIYYHIKNSRISLNINNILDKYYYLGGYDYTRAFVGSPRNYMLSIEHTF